MSRPRHAVAAGHALVAEAADSALRAGGSAVDACIAGALVACVAEPVLASLFAGGFLMARDARGKTRLLDFFVQTPRRPMPAGDLDFRAIAADFGGARQVFHVGAGSIATPGLAPGLIAAHDALGRIPLRDLAAPAAALARAGAPLSAFQAEVLGIVLPIFTASPPAQTLFLGGEAKAPAPGAVLPNPALGDVIETFAREGLRFMAEGEAAQALLRLTQSGGHLTADDLRRYAPRWREPLSVTRGGVRIALNPPHALGGALIAFALELMERGAPPAAIARAFEMTNRARLDAAIDGDAPDGAQRLLSAHSLTYWRQRLAGRPAATQGTTHISVIDGQGNAASMTLSNGAGCGLVAPGTGIMPNNMLGEADLLPGGFHPLPADMRLGSMMSPSVMTWPDGTVCALGSGGSNRIRTALAQVMARLTDAPGPLDAAVAAPRLHVEAQRPNRERDIPDMALDYEDRLREDARAALVRAYPQARPWARDSMFFGGVHAVRRDPRGGMEATGDHRRDGAALIG
jgi:gamma-glutamyltranspeptidase/glutathione hydrolase